MNPIPITAKVVFAENGSNLINLDADFIFQFPLDLDPNSKLFLLLLVLKSITLNKLQFGLEHVLTQNFETKFVKKKFVFEFFFFS